MLVFLEKISAHRAVNIITVMARDMGLKFEYPKGYATIELEDFPPILRSFHYYEDNDDIPDAATIESSFGTNIPTAVDHFSAEDELMMIERKTLGDFRGLPAFRCHMMNHATQQELAGCSSNVLPMSWAMYQRYDGLNTAEKKVADIAIEFKRASEEATEFLAWEQDSRRS